MTEKSADKKQFADRRQRRIQRRQHEIIHAAARVFAEKGYANTTTKDLAVAADIAEGTLYNYFGSKREILLAIAEEAESLMEIAVGEAGKLESREAIIEMFEMAFDISEQHLPFTRIMLAEAWMDDTLLQEFVIARMARISRSIQSFIAERVASGTFRPIDPALAARLAIGMFWSLILPVVRGIEPLPSPEERRAQAETVVDLLLDGIRVREA